MNQLPEESIFRIMQFIPVQQVFVCMRVNRKWKDAARHAVRIHKRVQVVPIYKLQMRFEIQIQNPMNLIMESNLFGHAAKLQLLAQSLLLMEKLEHVDTKECFLNWKQIHHVIVKNAASLQVLDTNCNLPSSRPAVVYQKLKKLDCRSLRKGTECPVLEDLTISLCCKTDHLKHLPIRTMRKFNYVFRPPSSNDSWESLCSCLEWAMPNNWTFGQNVFQAVKRLVHLTHLTINFGRGFDFHSFSVHDVSTFMDDFTSLVHLELTLPHIDFVFDQKVDRLVRQNPGLRKLIFWGLGLSDAALTSVARLRHLQDLQLEGSEVRFTVSGVLTLLSSRLRSLLLVARFNIREMTDEGRKEILDEFDRIAAERGMPLKVQDFVCPNYHIFSFKF